MKRWKQIFSGILATALTVSLLPGFSYKTEAGIKELPTTSLDTIEEGYYEVPMRLYTVDSTENSVEYSMGDNYIGYGKDYQKYAKVTVKDGKIKLNMDVDDTAGMNYFAYFDSEADYLTYTQAESDLFNGKIDEIPDATQALMKDTENAPDDIQTVVKNQTVTGNGESRDDWPCVDEATITVSACVPIYYAAFKAVGMSEGTALKYAKIGVDWSNLKKTGDIDNGGEDPTPQPDSILTTRYNELKTYFQSLNADEYITTQTDGENEIGWVTLEKFFEKWDESVANGTADQSQLKEELQSAYEKAYDPAYMRKQNTTLDKGYIYSVPVHWYAAKEKTISFTNEDGDLESFTVKVPDYDNTGEDAEFVNTVNELIQSATIATRDRRNELILTFDTEKQSKQEPRLTYNGFKFTSIGEFSKSESDEKASVKLDKLTGSGQTTANFVAKKTVSGLKYLYDGENPMTVVESTWNKKGNMYTTRISHEGFLVIDYSKATKQDGEVSKEADKSFLQGLYEQFLPYTEGYGELKDLDTSLSYMYAPEDIEKFSGDEGPVKKIKEVLDNPEATATEVDNLYLEYKDYDMMTQLKPLRDRYKEYLSKVRNEYSKYKDQTDVYIPESLTELNAAVEYFDYLEKVSPRVTETIDGKEVYGYLPGENIEVSKEEYDALLNTDQSEWTDEQKAQYEKWKIIGQISDRDYDPTNADQVKIIVNRKDNWYRLTTNYYRYKAMQKLDAALEKVEKYGDTTDVVNELTELKKITENEEESAKYTKKSISDLKQAIEDVQKVLDEGKVTEAKAAELKTTLDNAKAGLVDRTALKDAIAHGKELTAMADKYTDESLAAYTDELAKAESLYESTSAVTAEQIAAQVESLQKAEQSLVEYADTTEVVNEITELKKITESEEESAKYTKKSISNLKKAIEDVQKVLDEGKVTEAKAAELKTTLDNAKAGLVDRTALKDAIAHGNEIAALTDKYTEVSLAIYKAELAEAKKLYGSTATVTAEEIGAQIASLQAAEQSLVEKSSEDLDKDKLADGKYMVDVNLWHATQDKESMGNQALYHHGIITVKDGKYSLMIVGHEVTVGNITGKLKGLQVKPGGTAGEEWVTPDSVDGAGDGNYAFQFELTSKGEKEYLPSRIMVEEGTPMGTDWVESRLRISWDTLKKTGSTAGPSEIISGEIVPDVSGPFYYKDGATGVIVQAKEGVLPNGATVVVKKGTLNSDGSVLNSSLANYVKQYESYTVTAYDADGNEIQPDGILSISIPVPDGYDSSKLALYQLESTGTLKLLQGTNEDGLYTVNTASTGQFAIAEKIASTVKKPDNTLTTKTTTSTKTGSTLTTTPKTSTKTASKTGTTTKTATKSAAKTGDQANVALYLALAGLALAAGAVVIVRRRKESER